MGYQVHIMASQNVSKKRKFVADGVFFAELNELFTRELAEDGYSGVEVRQTPARREIIIRATRTQNVLGEKGRRIRELTAVVQKRFGFLPGSVELYAEKVQFRGLCAVAQAEALKFKLLGGLAVRRACYGVIRNVMESGAQGVEVIVSGKLRGQFVTEINYVLSLSSSIVWVSFTVALGSIIENFDSWESFDFKSGADLFVGGFINPFYQV